MKVVLNESQLRFLVERNVNNIKLNGTVFISYGTNEYDVSKIRPINTDVHSREFYRGISINKPIGGLWASPLTSLRSWGEWCSDNNFRLDALSKHFLFRLSKDSNIYIIDNINDLKKISTIKNLFGQNCINTPYLVQNYDGIFVTAEAVSLLRDINDIYLSNLYSWDVESLCVWNDNVIIPIEENAFEFAKIPNYSDKRDIDAQYDEEEMIKQDLRRKNLQMDNDFLKYGNQNVNGDMSQFFKGKHPGILSQLHGNNKDAKLAKKFNGTIKSGM